MCIPRKNEWDRYNVLKCEPTNLNLPTPVFLAQSPHHPSELTM